jgi:hypothetical protein
LRVPNGAWRPDTVITDYEGTEMFVLLDQTQEMRSYEAVFGDLEGRRLVCIKRHVIKAFWKDGYHFCTYKPNYPGQEPLQDRDIDNKKVYPFSYLQVSPMKGRFFYRYFDNQGGLSPPKMRADNPWLGFMVVCCTPMVRCGKWTASFKRRSLNAPPTIHVDQWRNCVDVGPGNDVLAALCIAYVFDRYQCQPLVTVIGMDDDDDADDNARDNKSINTHEPGPMDPLTGTAGGDAYNDGQRPNGGRGGSQQPPATFDPVTGKYYDENGQEQQPYYEDDDGTNGGSRYNGRRNGQHYDDIDGAPVDGPYYDNDGTSVDRRQYGNGQYYDDNSQANSRYYDDNSQANSRYYENDGRSRSSQYYDENGRPTDGRFDTNGPHQDQHYDDGQSYGQGRNNNNDGGSYYDDQKGQPFHDENDGRGDDNNQYSADGDQLYDDDGQYDNNSNNGNNVRGVRQPRQPRDLLDDHSDTEPDLMDDGRTRPTIV